MQINIGDKVRFLNEVGGGIVTRIIDADTVMVLNNEDEFEIPTLKCDLVVTEASQGHVSFAKSTTIQDAGNLAASPKKESLFAEKEEVYVAFSPREGCYPTESPLELYLINNTHHILLYSYFEENGKTLEGIAAGTLDPKSKILLKEYSRKELDELSSCCFQILYYRQGEYEIRKPLEERIKISPVKFHKAASYKETAYFHQDVVLCKLTGKNEGGQLKEGSLNEIKKAIWEKETAKPKSKQPKAKGQGGILEVDLHINALIDSVAGLSNADILEYQLNKFHEVMQEFQNEKGKKIVFIHGIGNGTLKKKVNEELRRKYKKHYQQDASFKEYGWGATMVTIR